MNTSNKNFNENTFRFTCSDNLWTRMYEAVDGECQQLVYDSIWEPIFHNGGNDIGLMEHLRTQSLYGDSL